MIKKYQLHCSYMCTYYLGTLWLDSEVVSGSFLVPTVDSTDIERIVCSKDQSRAAVIFTGTLMICYKWLILMLL